MLAILRFLPSPWRQREDVGDAEQAWCSWLVPGCFLRQELCFGLLEQTCFEWRLKTGIPQAICARG